MWAYNTGEREELDDNIIVYTARVCAIAALFYFIMFLTSLDHNMKDCSEKLLGNTDFDGQKIEGARYYDWLFTTPFWLYPLCIAGGLNDEGKFWAIILLDLVCNTCGTLAAYTGRKQWKKMMIFYGIGCIAYATNLGIWFVSGWFNDNELMEQLRMKTAISWSLYPVVFFLFVIKGLGRKDNEPGWVEVIVFALLDIYAKAILTIEFISYKHYDDLELGTIGHDEPFFHMKFVILVMVFGFIQYIYGNTDSCKPKEKVEDAKKEPVAEDSSSSEASVLADPMKTVNSALPM